MWREDGRLPIEAEDGTINIRLARKNGDVIGKITGGKVVRAIHDQIVVAQNLLRVPAREAARVELDRDMRIGLG